MAQSLTHVHQKNRQPIGALLHLLTRRRACKQEHQVRVLGTRGPHLLPIHHVGIIALLHRRGAKREGVATAGGLGHTEGLQAQATAGDFRQVALLLLWRAVTQDRPHGVHLGVAGGPVAPGTVDLFQHRRCRGNTQAASAIGLGDQRCQETRLGQRLDELLGIGTRPVQLAPVLAGETLTQAGDRFTDLGVGCDALGHVVSGWDRL